jgi:hypothetical protein
VTDTGDISEEQSVQLSKLVHLLLGETLADWGTIYTLKVFDVFADIVLLFHDTSFHIDETTDTTTTRRQLPSEGRGETHWAPCNLLPPCAPQEHLTRKVINTVVGGIISVWEIGVISFVLFRMRIRR